CGPGADGSSCGAFLRGPSPRARGKAPLPKAGFDLALRRSKCQAGRNVGSGAGGSRPSAPAAPLRDAPPAFALDFRPAFVRLPRGAPGRRGEEAAMALTRRQPAVYDFVTGFVAARGYSPSLEEIGAAFGLSSVATVHKHVAHLVEKGLLRKGWNRSRSLEPALPEGRPAVTLRLAGVVAAGAP